MSESKMFFPSTHPDRAWGKAQRHPQWVAVGSGQLAHVATGQRIYRAPGHGYAWVSWPCRCPACYGSERSAEGLLGAAVGSGAGEGPSGAGEGPSGAGEGPSGAGEGPSGAGLAVLRAKRGDRVKTVMHLCYVTTGIEIEEGSTGTVRGIDGGAVLVEWDGGTIEVTTFDSLELLPS